MLSFMASFLLDYASSGLSQCSKCMAQACPRQAGERFPLADVHKIPRFGGGGVWAFGGGVPILFLWARGFF